MTEHDSYSNPELEKLFKKYEEAPKSHIFAPLADACRKAGRLEEAVAVCQRGLELHPEYASGYVVLGKCLYDQRLMERAGDSFRRVLQMDAENLVALKYLGMILAEQGAMDEARKHFNRILALDPDNKEIAEKLGDLENPEEILDLAPLEDEDFEGGDIVLGNESPESADELATVTLADIFAAQGYKDKAGKIYREVLDRDPDNETVMRKLQALNEVNSAAQPGAEDADRPDAFETPFGEDDETGDGGLAGGGDVSEAGADSGGGMSVDQANPPIPEDVPSHSRNRTGHASKIRESGGPESEIADEKSLDQFRRWLKNAGR
ncbi:MAG: tetratricopeptide repeat protein [Chitinivibrionia bacterium]|nr:tetratricopeptide repeat protein [Chitinivibrionia bacterium]